MITSPIIILQFRRDVEHTWLSSTFFTQVEPNACVGDKLKCMEVGYIGYYIPMFLDAIASLSTYPCQWVSGSLITLDKMQKNLVQDKVQ